MLVNVKKGSSYFYAKKLEKLQKKYAKIQKNLDESFEDMAKKIKELGEKDSS